MAISRGIPIALSRANMTSKRWAILSIGLAGLTSWVTGCEGSQAPEFLCGPIYPAPAASVSPTPTPTQIPVGGDKITPEINALTSALWNIAAIPVCWEDSALQSSVSADDRALVQQAIHESWETALSEVSLPAHQQIHFVGWQSCAVDTVAASTGLRVASIDARPETAGLSYKGSLGQELAGVPNGVRLNFTFQNWEPACAVDSQERSYCIYAIAVHEFGHALGLAHEQNRTDTASPCSDQVQGPNGNVYYGKWDPQSVMNYCNASWDDAGILSSNDQAGIRTLYYPALATQYCGSPQPGATP